MKRIEKIGLIGLVGLMGLMGEVRGQAVLEADTIALGDQTTLSVPLTADSMPALGFPPQVVVLGQKIDTATHTLQSLVTSFEPGEHYIHLSDCDSLPLVVTDVEVDTSTAEIRDIAPIQKVPYSFWEIFRWVLLAWAVAAIGIVVWWLIDRKKRHGSIFVHHEPVDTRTPEERASQSLDELRGQKLWQNGKVKEYHTELTDIVRRFIEEATSIRATDMTSDETIEALEDEKWREESGLLRSIFTTADLVKFAKGEPLPQEHEASMDNAGEFVRRLWQCVKPQEEEVPHE